MKQHGRIQRKQNSAYSCMPCATQNSNISAMLPTEKQGCIELNILAKCIIINVQTPKGQNAAKLLLLIL